MATVKKIKKLKRDPVLFPRPPKMNCLFHNSEHVTDYMMYGAACMCQQPSVSFPVIELVSQELSQGLSQEPPLSWTESDGFDPETLAMYNAEFCTGVATTGLATDFPTTGVSFSLNPSSSYLFLEETWIREINPDDVDLDKKPIGNFFVRNTVANDQIAKKLAAYAAYKPNDVCSLEYHGPE